jgi:uncharacterized membrane protein YtjA (UPF0391 family)
VISMIGGWLGTSGPASATGPGCTTVFFKVRIVMDPKNWTVL